MAVIPDKVARRQVLIDKRSQIYLSLLVILYLVVFTIIIIACIMIPSILGFTRASNSIEAQYLASREFLLMDQRVVPVIIIAMVLLAGHFIFVTNRIFGPLYRLRMVLSAWRQGEWPRPFKGRTKDFHEEFFTSFNLTTEQLKGDLSVARHSLASSLETLAKIRADLPAETAARLADTEQSCRTAFEKLERYDV
jgi:hypothetical protein